MDRKLFVTITVAMLAFALAKAQAPAPVIKATSTQGCAPLTVGFSDGGTGGSTYAWTFPGGNPASSTSASTNVIFSTPGSYTVTMSSTNANGTTAATPVTIVVYPSPTADFNPDKTTGCYPTNIKFTDASTPGAGATVVSWTYDYGDGNVDNGNPNPTHTYHIGGSFPVTLYVKNNYGCLGTASIKTVSHAITLTNGVLPNVSDSLSAACQAPMTAFFNNQTTGPGTLTYAWDFGDGATSTTQSPNHTYTSSGTFTAKMVAISNQGCGDTARITVVVPSNSNVSDFSVPAAVCQGVPVQLINASSPTPNESVWSYDDGSPDDDSYNTVHTFTTTGPHTITLRNDFPNCSGQVSKTVQVVTPVSPDFTATNTNACKPSLTVQFTGTAINAISWDWDFGDGSPHGTTQNPSHTYSTYGNFTVTLTVSNASGCSSSISKPSFVNVTAPTVKVNNLPAYGCAPGYTFTPDLSSNTADGIKSYAWDFGNGQTSTIASPTNIPYNPGKYFVKITITTNGGCTATFTDSLKVGTTKPVPDFVAAPLTACVGQSIQFTDKSTGADQWLWAFADQGTSTAENPVFAFPRPGTFAITLTAFNKGCSDSKTQTAYITIKPPLAGFKYSVNCSNPSQYTFVDTSAGPTTWDWDFGDGSSHATVQNPPVHTYPGATASYTVTLTVTNGGCSNSISQKINVHPVVTLTPETNPACTNVSVTIDPAGPSYVTGFTYDFGDGQTGASGVGASTFHTWTSPGDYIVKAVATVSAGACPDSAQFTMHVNGPKAAFTAPVTQACGTLNASFQDQSTPTGAALKSWFWDFGDNGTSTAENPSHNYAIQGLFPVKLKVTDASGCVDSVIKGGFITLSIPRAKFSASDTNTCPSKAVQFVNSSGGGFSPTYTWDFGNGNTSTSSTPPLQYFAGPPLPSDYTVKLTLTDKYSCTASTQIKIHSDTPKATFTASATYSACPPLLDQFTFTGSYNKKLSWNFGDGATSADLNPQHLYPQPGDNYVTLTVTSPGGCVATSDPLLVHLDGPLGKFDYDPKAACGSLDVTMNVQTSNVAKFIWYYGDNTPVPDTTTTPSVSHHYGLPGQYVPSVALIDAQGCKIVKTGTDTIYIDGIVKASFTIANPTICDSGDVSFANSSQLNTGTAIETYTWDFGDGTGAQPGTNPNPVHHYTAPGIYTPTLNILTLHGCTANASGTMTVVASPKPDIQGIVNACEPATETLKGILTVADPNITGWSWDFKNGQTSTLQNPPVQSFPKAGNYLIHLTATNSSGCTGAKDSNLYVYPHPEVYAGNDTTICLGGQADLNADGNAVSYLWLPPTNAAFADPTNVQQETSPTTTTFYYIQGKSAFGCTTNDTVTVKVNLPPNLAVSNPDTICVGDQITLHATGAEVYTWTPATGLSDPASANPVASPATTTTYQVDGTDDIGCFHDVKTVKITVYNYPVVNLGPDQTIPVGTSYQVPGTGSDDITTIVWTPQTALSCTDCVAPVASPMTTTTYQIKVSNDGGCASGDTLTLKVICDGSNFFVPNTFSPNGDNHNDRFIIQGSGLNIIPSLTIFNRWGQIVYQRRSFAPNDPSVAWDGTFNGTQAPSDVYVYTIEILCNNGAIIQYHGNVTLIR